MDERERPDGAPGVDELWLGDWAAEGINALKVYLVKHAAFEDFLAGRDERDPDDGDGAA